MRMVRKMPLKEVIFLTNDLDTDKWSLGTILKPLKEVFFLLLFFALT